MEDTVLEITDEEKEKKKSHKKSLVTAGLATVATIHAAHNVYQSVEKRNARREALKEGDITPEQARRQKNKARLQDVASVGIAALGVKGAYSEWKEMKEHREEVKEKRETMERHRQKREARRRKAEELQRQHYMQSGYTGSLPNFHPPGGAYYGSDGAYSQGAASPYAQVTPTQYYDDNPYSAYAAPPPPPQFPPPPMGPNHAEFPPPPTGPPRAETH